MEANAMQESPREVVVGVFRGAAQARDALEALRAAGYTSERVSLLSPTTDELQAQEQESAVGSGVIAGGVFGGLAGWLVGLAALAVPGVGPVVGMGVLVTAISGATLGAGIGAVVGALGEMGVPEERARWYEEQLRAGATLVTVHVDERATADVQAILARHGAYNLTEAPLS
jgi:hypothetical protein